MAGQDHKFRECLTSWSRREHTLEKIKMPAKNNRNQRPPAPQEKRQCNPYWMIRNAESLRRVVKHLQEPALDSLEADPDLFSGRGLAGPILLTLAIELALKAWLCQEQGKDPPRGHDLLELFHQLKPENAGRTASTDARLDHVSGRLPGGSSLPARIAIAASVESPGCSHTLAVHPRETIGQLSNRPARPGAHTDYQKLLHQLAHFSQVTNCLQRIYAKTSPSAADILQYPGNRPAACRNARTKPPRLPPAPQDVGVPNSACWSLYRCLSSHAQAKHRARSRASRACDSVTRPWIDVWSSPATPSREPAAGPLPLL